jgi:hypothetical protein
MQTDLCVFLSGENLNAYTPLFVETLFRNCDVSRLHIHVVAKGHYLCPNNGTPNYLHDLTLANYVGIGDNILKYLECKKAESKVPFTIYNMPDPTPFFEEVTPGPPRFGTGSDHASTLHWAMDNCGTNKYVIFCHSDIVFMKDIITPLMGLMHDRAGIKGVYNHCYIVNRDAFRRVGVRFNCVVNFMVVPTLGIDGVDYVLRHAGDSRCGNNAKRVHGFDIGELVEFVMRTQGWDCDIYGTHPLRDYVDHMCSGHGYVAQAEVITHHKQRIDEWLKKYGVQKI